MINPLQVIDSNEMGPSGQGYPTRGSTSGDCGSSPSAPIKRATGESKLVQTDVSFNRRRINLGAVPETGTYVSCVDLDLTVECNLRCLYCFKEKWNEHMEERVAFDAIIWLLYASGPRRQLNVNFMGGEPLIQFRLIKKLVPFAKRRASQIGKSIHFGVTTNGTLVTNKVVNFWKKWGMGFHTSIDGTPDVQNRNRPTSGGRGSSKLVEKAVPKILAYRPGSTARSTVVPESAGTLVEGYRYFRSLGYTDIAFVPGGAPLWNKTSVSLFEEQYRAVAELVVDEFRQGTFILMKGLNRSIEGIVRNQRPQHACGAGRGLLLIDIHGDIWPCHRWNKKGHESWKIGNIYEQFDDLARAELDRRNQTELLEQDCENCVANKFCSGGCPAENLEETGAVYRRHPNSCDLTRVFARVGQYVHDTLCEERNATFMNHYYTAEKEMA